MDDNLGDKILSEYMKNLPKESIINNLMISEEIYNTWKKINKSELKQVDVYLQKQLLKNKLKIKTLPVDDDDDDVEVEHVVEVHEDVDRKVHALIARKNQIQDKINKLIDLESNKRIGQLEFNKAIQILNDEITLINKMLS